METTTEKMKKELSMEDILAMYVKHKNGAIFQILEHKQRAFVWLRAKNKYTKVLKRDIKQGIVDGNWLEINEHEWKQWVEKDNAYIEEFAQKLVKRIILTQLLIELDDELIDDCEDQPQFRKLLERTNKESERIAIKNYDRLYTVDKSVLKTLMTAIDEVTGKMAKCSTADFIHINNIVQAYLENREDFKEVPVLLETED